MILGKCVVGTWNCFGFGKKGHKVRDCPSIMAREKESKQVLLSVSGDDVPETLTSMHSGIGDQSRMVKMMLVSYILLSF